jgi:hypothetical protein
MTAFRVWLWPRYARPVRVGTTGRGGLASVDGTGTVHLDDGTSMRWFVAADDRWHLPHEEPTVRQRLIEGVPVVETSVRIPGGDAVERVYGVPEWGGAVVAEFENTSTLPIAIALDRRDVRTSRPPADVPVHGIELPPDSIVLPVGHGSMVRVAVGTGIGSLGAVPSAADVGRGWVSLLDRSPRVSLPDDRVVERIRSERAQLVLGAPPDPSGDEVEFIASVSELVRIGEPAEPWVASVAAAAQRLARRRLGGEVIFCRAAEIMHAAGQVTATRDIARLPRGDGRSGGWLTDTLDGLAASSDSDTVHLLAGSIPDDWFGQPIDVHGAPVGGRTISFAIRWHGSRPAVLWESNQAVTMRCGLDSSWTQGGTSGEALLGEFPTTK